MQRLGEKFARNLMLHIDPERAHGLAIQALRHGLGPKAGQDDPALSIDIAGMKLSNPVGLAAGFDKNGIAIAPLLQAGFGFIEIGAVTPRPQPGNPKPRLFRLREDEAAINRFGFNNEGMDAVATRLSAARPSGVLGVNLGANKDSDDRSADYALVYRNLGPLVDFCTINVSSPNTEKLRDLQGIDALRAIIDKVKSARAAENISAKLFLKIAPDLTVAEIEAIAALVAEEKLDALIATNTTITRPNLHSKFADEKGGLSGKPLQALSTSVIARAYSVLKGEVPIIGVGGIDSGAAAVEKMHAGAAAVQLYTALVYKGFPLIDELKSAILKANALENVGGEYTRFL